MNEPSRLTMLLKSFGSDDTPAESTEDTDEAISALDDLLMGGDEEDDVVLSERRSKALSQEATFDVRCIFSPIVVEMIAILGRGGGGAKGTCTLGSRAREEKETLGRG